MLKVRNAVIIIILCIIAGFSLLKKKPQPLGLPTMPPEELRDAVAASPNRSKPHKLALNPDDDGQLKDALAEGPAIPTGAGFNGFAGNHAPPRGSGDGGIGNRNGPNPLAQFLRRRPRTPDVSPSGPEYDPQ